MSGLTERQRNLARHALGLTNPAAKGRSYRNRFFAYEGSDTHAEWSKMTAAGLAGSQPDEGQSDWFWLAPEGARLALDPGESLCPEDFPHDR